MLSLRRNKRMVVLKNLQQYYFHNIILFSFVVSCLSSSSFLSHHVHVHVQAHLFIYAGCSQNKFQSPSPFENNLNSVLSSIISSSSQTSYNSFAIGNGTSTTTSGAPPDGVAAYGLYQCRGDLRTSECADCIRNAVGQINLVCPYCYGGTLQLEGCFVRYENQDFLGKLDTNVMFKKCSTSSSNDVEFFKRRDDVLADLQAANGFRVSSLGMVEGFAQCLGDLDQGECSSCLGEAVGKLKNVCGSAAAADVYLGQCYARYWASGYYDSNPDPSSEDQIGKTIAIIVGVLAGIALIVVLLSLMRKAAG